MIRIRNLLEKSSIKNHVILRRNATSVSYHDPEYQFLQQSKVPTLHFQQSLPRLPIPLLEKTCERYLAALKPLLIDEGYRKSEDVINRFKTTTGLQLQKMLKEKDSANKHTSYISEPWFDMYLRDRKPLPLNYNVGLMLNHDIKKEYNDQLIRTTNLVVSSLRFMRSLRAECLEPEVFHLDAKKSDTDRFRRITKLAPKSIATFVAYAFKAFPLDMSQYNGLFGATRIPETDKDRIYRNKNTKHIMILRNGNFYAVDVLDNAGYIESPSVILGRIQRVLNDNTPPPEYKLGLLTAIDRNEWARLRYHLTEIGNEKQMKQIDSALFCVCLDDNVYNDEKSLAAVRNFLASDGTNRWFDKSISVIVSKDGTAGINFEHSWGDGVAVLRYFNEIYNETTKSPIIHPNMKPQTNDNDESIKLIEFNFDDRIKEGITNAQKSHNSVMDSLDLDLIQHGDISKEYCKKHNLSPDAVMQLSFQLAFKQQYDRYVGTYESCSTAAFLHGRTETMRPCTSATKAFCDTVLLKNSSPDKKKLKFLIHECSKIHKNLTNAAAMGQGFDRHLFGLRNIAEQHGLKKPNVFEDSAYELINHNILSTSTLTSNALLAGSFGPVVKDGFGIAYNMRKHECGAIVSSYKGQRDGKGFVESLRKSLDTIKNVLDD